MSSTKWDKEERHLDLLDPLWIRIEFDDGKVYDFPVSLIAKDRAENYKHEFGNDLERSLLEDTIPLFLDNYFEITDWAKNNMHYLEVSHAGVLVSDYGNNSDLEDQWCNNVMKVVLAPHDNPYSLGALGKKNE